MEQVLELFFMIIVLIFGVCTKFLGCENKLISDLLAKADSYW